MERALRRCRIRPLRFDDASALARHMDDEAVWRNLRDRVPRPYTVDAARAFLVTVVDVTPQTVWGIEVGGEAVGAIGVQPQGDVYRRTLELGFWLGRAHWGRGIASEVVPVVVEHALATWPDVLRIQAEVFAWNPASARVLEKSGFVREGVLRQAVTKGGRTTDLLIYARLRVQNVQKVPGTF